MSYEGQLDIHFKSRGRVAVMEKSPVDINAFLSGRGVDEASGLLSSVFPVCRQAQGLASSECVHGLKGQGMNEADSLSGQVLVMLESLREHCLRVLMDWPEYVNADVHKEALRGFVTLLSDMQKLLLDQSANKRMNRRHVQDCMILTQHGESLLEKYVLSESPQVWLDMTQDERIGLWLEQSGSVAASMLRHVVENNWQEDGSVCEQNEAVPDSSSLFQWFQSGSMDAFALNDGIAGRKPIPELSCYTRWQDHPWIADYEKDARGGVLSRLKARLLDMVSLPGKVISLLKGQLDVPVSTVVTRDNVAISRVAIARGELFHAVSVDKGRISSYRTLSPTNWNFFVNGAAARSLAGLQGCHENLQRRLELLIQCFDPCVKYSLVMD